MGKFVLQRLILMVITLFVIISLTFILMINIPGRLGVDDPNMNATLRAKLIQKYGLDKSVPEQYFIFIGNVFKGDLGTSTTLYPQRDVFEVIVSKLPVTIQLNLLSSFIVYPIGLALGIVMAIKKNTMTDTVLNVVVVFFISVPGFVVAALLQYFLGFKLNWFPILLSTDKPNQWYMSFEKLHSMILPMLALSFGGIMGMARSMRGELSETLTSDFMLLAKTKGLTHRQATLRHAFRNSFLPMTGVLVSAFVSLLFGSLYIENQFGIPGVGGILTKAIGVLDIPMAIGWMIMMTTIGLVSVILTDILYGVVDPRVRIGGKKSGA